MSNERTTIEYETKGGRKLVMRDYITGREGTELMDIAKMKIESGESAETKAQKRAFEMVIVSIDGVTEKVADLVLDMPLSEFQEITEKITSIIQPAKK